MGSKQCSHESVVVDYDHPHGLLQGTATKDLQTSPREQTRPRMTLLNPRCSDCGKLLTKQDLAQRVKQTGDLYDERFIFDFS